MKMIPLLVLSAALTAAAFLAGTRWRGVSGGSGAAEPTDASAGAPSSPPPAAVRVSHDQQRLLGIRTVAVGKGPIRHTARLFGRVVLDQTRVFVLNAATEGSIREVSPATTGSRVKKGQRLASFFSLETRAPLQAYLSALDVEAQDPAAWKREGLRVARGFTARSGTRFAIERLRDVGISDPQIEEIGRTRELPLTIQIRAPVDGFVLARNVSPGQKFDKGAEWYRVANLDRVWILAVVSADEAPHLRPGLRVQVAIPGRKVLPARVSEILPQIDATSRRLEVRLEADNPGHALRPDMFVDVALPIELPAATTVPVDAVIDSGLKKTVFVERGDGSLEPRAIETGWRFGERIEVVKGLEGGERVVVSGTFLVDSESRLRLASAGLHGATAVSTVPPSPVTVGHVSRRAHAERR